MLKSTSVIIAVLLSSAAFAEGDASYPGGGPGIERGNNMIGFSGPFVSDRTYRPVRNFQPGPFRELGPKDKVEWRR